LALDHTKLERKIEECLSASGFDLPGFRVYHPESDGPRRFGNTDLLAFSGRALEFAGASEWDLVLASRTPPKSGMRMSVL
jgi:hypothetical protein